ncbi:MAG: hypothetical protein WCT47_22440 [Betaproteobacteria bacterium]|jgi:tetratricopeptide (TPR) repeat protein
MAGAGVRGLSPDAGVEQVLQHALAARQQGDLAAARLHYLAALQRRPDDVDLAVDAAACCLAVNDLTGAAQALKGRRSDALPDGLGARLLFAQALVLKRLNRPDEAAGCFDASLRRASAQPALARQVRREWSDTLLNSLGDARAAAQVYGAQGLELEINPGRFSGGPLADDEEAWLARLVAGLYTGDLGCAALVEGFKSFADRHLATGSRPAAPGPARRRGPRPGRRLRIGFISNQFCSSPVGFLTLATIEELSRLADLVLFDRGAKQDWAHRRFRGAARDWVACQGLTPAQLADQLRGSDLDAVFDLAGWMDLDVLRALAGRPVGRQFKWVGGQSLTTGLAVFDGFVADIRQVPPGSEPLYTEPVRRLEGSYVTYASPPYRDLSAPAASPPAVRQVRPGHFALVSNPAKIGAGTVAMVRALKPQRLVLLDHRWRFAHPRRLAAQWFGGHVGQVDIVTPANHPAYLDALQDLDAAVLDTQPYSMGLTAVELRLLGVPIMLGPRPAMGTMREFHARAHLGAARFDRALEQAHELVNWCATP